MGNETEARFRNELAQLDLEQLKTRAEAKRDEDDDLFLIRHAAQGQDAETTMDCPF